jgi:uncharacterized protein (DUF2225 family)
MNDTKTSPSILIPCPYCGHDFEKTPKELQPGARFSCPACNTEFDSADFNHGVRRIGKTLGEFMTDFRRKFPYS